MTTISKYLLAATIAFTAISAPVAALADDKYGTIAYSQSTGAHGWSVDQPSQVEAENAAMSECYKHAKDCKVAYSFVNACGALAVGGDGGWGADWGANMSAAENKAVHTCSGYSYECKVVVEKCVSGL